jgi:type II secretory pathway predicted ATPase ExeA
MIEPSTRLHGVEQLISEKKYFVIHAARQSGKTTYIQDLTYRLNAGGRYYALYTSLEGIQNIVEPEQGIPAIVQNLQMDIEYSTLPHRDEFAAKVNYAEYANVLRAALTDYCILLDKPLIIFFDEADCLSEDTLISFLRQLRNGYNNRSRIPFVHSVALVGMRNIRDYKAKIRPDSQSLGSASPFNIVTETFTLENFTQEEVAQLYRQHTDETGQRFEEDAVKLAWEQTQGQPWLVNAIARDAIVKILQSDFTKPVTTGLVNEAIQRIILDRPTHIDSLLDKLQDERVRRIIEPMILGEGNISKLSDDFLYTRDLGLIRVLDDSTVAPACPIYAEIIVRWLSSLAQEEFSSPGHPYKMPRYLKDGRIDMDYLMKDFQEVWHERGKDIAKQLDCIEAAPYLTMLGFLRRIVNGGQIIYNMASGSVIPTKNS